MIKKIGALVILGVCLWLILPIWSATDALAGCTTGKVKCWGPNPYNNKVGQLECGEIEVPSCYHTWYASCGPCGSMCNFKATCNARYPTCCKDDCQTSWEYWGSGSWYCGPPG